MLLVVLAMLAFAADGIALDVQVGKRVERNVGNAIGWFCDDPALVDATIVTRDDVNYWLVTGVKAGTTQCRVGTDVTRASFVFDVTIRSRKSGR